MPGWLQAARVTHGGWIERLQIDLPAVLKGTNGPDSITGTREAEVIFGYGGADTLVGAGGGDTIFGGGGRDSIVANGSRGTVFAGSGNDFVSAYGGNLNLIHLGDGDDRASVGGSAIVHGGDGADVITAFSTSEPLVAHGGSGADRITGSFGDDTLFGGSGNDSLQSFVGDDVMFAGAGDDWIFDDGGDDVISTGAGRDLIDFYALVALHGGDDTITDFDQGEDRFVISPSMDVDAVIADAERTPAGLRFHSGNSEVLLLGFYGQLAAEDFILGWPSA